MTNYIFILNYVCSGRNYVKIKIILLRNKIFVKTFDGLQKKCFVKLSSILNIYLEHINSFFVTQKV